MMTLLEAMARQEGWGIPGARATRNNNPGNIEWGKFTHAHGATHGDPRFAVFPEVAMGWAAMKALLASAYANSTIAEMLGHYAPPDENQTSTYLADVCEWTGCKPVDLVGPLLWG